MPSMSKKFRYEWIKAMTKLNCLVLFYNSLLLKFQTVLLVHDCMYIELYMKVYH